LVRSDNQEGQVKKKTTTAVLAVSAAAVLVAALAGAGFAASGKKAAAGDTCLVTDVGGLNDKGFNQLANIGLQKAVKDLGIKGRVLTSTSSADYIPNLLSCIQGGSDLTIGVGFLMADAVNTVAAKFPNSKFAIIDYSFADLPSKPANTRGILFREQEAGYLSGWLAVKELMVQKKPLVLGAVGGVKIPPVDHFIAGYQAGAKAANPKAKVLYGYSQSFTDQGKCKELALNQIAQGSQVEFAVAGSCGLGTLSAAKDKGLWGIGVDADQAYLGDFMLTSAVKRVDAGVLRTIKQAKDGTFKGYGNTIFSVRAGGVGLGKISPKVPKSIIAEAGVLQKKLATGKVKGIPTTVA
jgi:basic membrane protein A and related proteins